MGVTRNSFNHLNRVISNYGKLTQNLTLVELGIQEAVEPMGFKYLRDTMKNGFASYISLDLHNTPGATIFDLSEYVPNAYRADILTNFGTTEHVEYEQGQYNCWLNMHSWLKVGGLAIHHLPEIGSWKGHCRYYTNFEFYRNLENYGYRVLELDNHSDHNGNLNWCVLQKADQIPFMDYDVFYKHMIIDAEVELSSVHPMNNPKKLA